MNLGLVNYKSKDNSKAVNKLFDLIGKFFEPYHKRKNADATAYEIRVVTEAINENVNTVDKIEYKDSKLFLEKKAAQKDDEHIGFIDESLSQEFQKRAFQRHSAKIFHEQQNIEEIIEKTIHQLNGIDEVSDKVVDNDWLTKFLNSAEDISNEEMQNLWAKVLAGEVVKPGSFSLRTLKLIESLTQEDARIIEKFASRRISCIGYDFILSLNANGTKDFYDSNINEELLLQELGVITNTEINFFLESNEIDGITIIDVGDSQLIQLTNPTKPHQTINRLYSFTTIGKELIKLVELVRPSNNYLQVIATKFNLELGDFYYSEKNLDISYDTFNLDSLKNFKKLNVDKDKVAQYLKKF